jgi:hypothetical protein
VHERWRRARAWTWSWIWPAYFVRLVAADLSYDRPGFHPAVRDSRSLLDHRREQLFGAAGSHARRTTIVAASALHSKEECSA